MRQLEKTAGYAKRREWRDEDSERYLWHFIPVDPAFVASFRRWNLVISSVLSFIVLGVFAMVLAPHTGHASFATYEAVYRLDKHIEDLTPSLARDLGISSNIHGVLITSVDPESAAAAAGLRGGDVIEGVDRTPVRSVNDFRRAFRRDRGHEALLLIDRRGSSEVVVVRPR